MSNPTVKFSGWLSVSCPGVAKYPNAPHMWKTSAKLSVGKPSVANCDIAVKVAVDLPASLFLRPSLEAKISVPDHAIMPLQIDMEVIDNIQELIHSQTGFDVRLVQDGKEGA